jgi:hypothetical protein
MRLNSAETHGGGLPRRGVNVMKTASPVAGSWLSLEASPEEAEGNVARWS